MAQSDLYHETNSIRRFAIHRRLNHSLTLHYFPFLPQSFAKHSRYRRSPIQRRRSDINHPNSIWHCNSPTGSLTTTDSISSSLKRSTKIVAGRSGTRDRLSVTIKRIGNKIPTRKGIYYIFTHTLQRYHRREIIWRQKCIANRFFANRVTRQCTKRRFLFWFCTGPFGIGITLRVTWWCAENGDEKEMQNEHRMCSGSAYVCVGLASVKSICMVVWESMSRNRQQNKLVWREEENERLNTKTSAVLYAVLRERK